MNPTPDESIRSREAKYSTSRYPVPKVAAPLMNPLAAWVEFAWLSTSPANIRIAMLSFSGGTLYLIFDDIAPRWNLKHNDFPAIGAESGFLLGLSERF